MSLDSSSTTIAVSHSHFSQALFWDPELDQSALAPAASLPAVAVPHTPSPSVPSTPSVALPATTPVAADHGGTPAGSLPSAMTMATELMAAGTPAPLFFLDYDGTLAPIVADPERAFLPEATRATLAQLVRCAPVAIVSGRARAKVERFVGLPAGPHAVAVAHDTPATAGCLYYAGSHGFDISGPSGGVCRHMTVAETHLETLSTARTEIERRLGIAPDGFGTGQFVGASVEDNWLAFSVHFRRCPNVEQVAPLIERVVDAVLHTQTDLKKTFGKCVFEVRPRIDWDKGRAVEWLMEALKKEDGLEERAFTPIYIGDDKTDEDAFQVLSDGRGVSILVQDPEVDSNITTKAQFILKNPAEVQQFLQQFL